MGFPTVINAYSAIGVEGDFASVNPRKNVVGGHFGLVACAAGTTVGKFAWIDPTGTGTPVTSNAAAPLTTAPDGFVHRDLGSAMITNWLADASMVIPAGLPVSLFNGGDLFARNTSGAAVARGVTVYASLTDGSISFTAGAGVVATSFKTTSAANTGELVIISA
jgi:hypothetical protein